MDYIKERLRAEPARSRSADSLVCVFCVLFVDLHSLSASTTRSSIGHHLCVTALLQADEPEDSLLDCLADGQDAVVY